MLQQIVYDDYEGMSAKAADLIIDLVKDIPNVLLCFATGNTPVATYRLLVQKAKEQQVDFSRCFFIGLDEWVGVPAGKSGSCHYILHEQLFKPLAIKDAQIHLFNGTAADMEAECSRMNAFIEVSGGIDLMVAGIGLNGHIGFNEPGADINSRAHIQELHSTTLASGQHYFNEPTIIQKGITLGMAQVLEARTLLLLANGQSKAAILQQAVEGAVTNQVPASYMRKHENAVLLMDTAAASLLTNNGID